MNLFFQRIDEVTAKKSNASRFKDIGSWLTYWEIAFESLDKRHYNDHNKDLKNESAEKLRTSTHKLNSVLLKIMEGTHRYNGVGWVPNRA